MPFAVARLCVSVAVACLIAAQPAMATGKLLWKQQLTPGGDAWNIACGMNTGPDHDVGPSTILRTVRDFETVNGVKARGGTLNGAGPVVAGGMVLVGWGYRGFGQLPGNVLLCLSVGGK